MRLIAVTMIAVVLLVSTAAYGADDALALRAGAATSDITPDLGSEIIGGFAPFPATHVHDDLHVRCLVLDDGRTKLALAVCDLVGIHRRVSDEARMMIVASTGIPPECVLVSATHTHSAASALGENGYDDAQELDAYQQFVVRRIADGVRRAANTLRPAELAIGTVDVPEHLFNRRWYMKAGTMPENPFGGLDEVKMNPPAGSENLLEPAGPTDPTISFLALREPDGRPISIFATYSLHYVGGVGDGHISADYFACFCDEVSRLLNADRLDPQFVALLANGTSGDINNINFRNPRPAQPPYQQMRYVAADVAAKVHGRLSELTYRSDVRLDARYREAAIKWRKPTEEQLSWARTTLETHPEEPGKTDLSRIYAERTMRLNNNPETASVPLQVLAIGEACIGTMPCEVFCEIGLEFRDRSPLKPAWMVSLNHGYYGYLPTPRQHRLGGYETWIGTNRLERDASVIMLDQLLEMVVEIQMARQP
jgi:neutral ceramidase